MSNTTRFAVIAPSGRTRHAGQLHQNGMGRVDAVRAFGVTFQRVRSRVSCGKAVDESGR